MNPWNKFIYAVAGALACWLIALLLSTVTGQFLIFKSNDFRRKLAIFFEWCGLAFLFLFIVYLWLKLERPPIRTLGETRLWHAFLVPLTGLLVQWRYKIRWLTVYCIAMSVLFLALNVLKPDAHDKTLMPALQSFWFVPHVIVYMVAYALLGGSFFTAVHALVKKNEEQGMKVAQTLVSLGVFFLSTGLCFGALWAKEAWGHYWTWDPKETWALITWVVYLAYLHGVMSVKQAPRASLWVLVAGFAVVLACWFGVNQLPSANQSVHTYTRD